MAFFSRLRFRSLICRASSTSQHNSNIATTFNTDAAVVSRQHYSFNLSRNASSSSKLFVGGLSWGVDEHLLRDAFASYGTVTEVEIVTDHETGRSKGYGFVNFTSNEEAEAALRGMNGRDLVGRTIRADYAVQKTGGFRSGLEGLKNKHTGHGSSNTSCLDKLSRKANVIGTYGSHIGGNWRNL